MMQPDATSEQEETENRTRQSLILRLSDWKDQRSWDEFYRSYHRLIFSVARQSGLNEAESWDVVQETLLTVARQSREGTHSYDPARGPFKAWLLRITRWRIHDAQRLRAREHTEEEGWEKSPPQVESEFEQLWEHEWQQNVMRAALARVKLKVSPRQFQIFDFNVLNGMPVAEVRSKLGVSAAQVYLAKHRVGSALRHELAELGEEVR